jgi:hypothetical protein
MAQQFEHHGPRTIATAVSIGDVSYCSHFAGYPVANNVAWFPATDWIEKKFIRLRDEWKENRGRSSSTVDLVMHSAYQRIIGMGMDAVPFILRELQAKSDRWYWALRAITEEDPVAEADRGNSEAMRQSWLKWGRDRGYKC